MKKSSKIILTLLALIVAVYGIFVFADSKRLEKADKGTKPIITISEDEENHSFMGLGYNVKYYLNEGETEYKNAYGAECRLFGKILLWAYVQDKDNEEERISNKGSGWVLVPMIMVNDELYLDTGHTNNEAKCGVMDGEISSSVEAYERPTENDQSNFGKGYGYQLGAEEGTIEVLIDGKWVIYATEEKRAEIQNVNN